ncbi:chemotaxis protein CheW [Brevundimonas sp.]|uniref:chemotaxis protein CheW n=1 Tax=Brevundimonas sp. TaxID=1871086 RepID=UPI003919DDEF
MDDVIQEFVAEAREGIEALDCKLVTFEQHPDDPELLGDIFRLIHTIKGTSGFLGLGRLQAVAHAGENVLGAFRDGTLEVSADAVSAVLQAVDVVRLVIDGIASDGVEPPGDDRRLIERLDRIFEAEPQSQLAVAGPASTGSLLERLGGEATLDAACECVIGTLVRDEEIGPHLAGADLDTLQAALRGGLVAQARGTNLDGFAVALAQTFPRLSAAQGDRFTSAIRHALIALEADAAAVATLLPEPGEARDPAATPELAAAAFKASVEPDPGTVRGAPESETANQTIRVSVDVLENLMTMVSEMVLIRNQLIQTLRSVPDSPFAGPLHRLNQVTSELQEGVMTTRMQPISGAWAKLPRLVRDLASELGKQIELSTSGADTELDRQVLELIKDPLTHMIRNAADHGLETPAERLTFGKPATGRITLSARHEGGAIVVEMADDGRGLNADRIRAKAMANGLVSAAQAAAMSDVEARQLIFLPGFSTAEQITSVSGRGVGMDVVRTNIEKIGGVIELSSVPGVGTRFVIRIPLTLSIISALIVESCGERFAMPQASIIELVSAIGSEGRRIEQINGASVLRLRDRLLPLVSLQSMLGLTGPDTPRVDACIVVAKVGVFTFGIIVDRVFDTEEIVVKPVASVLRHLKLYSGATILGDGSVIMILDFKGMSMEAGASDLVGGPETGEGDLAGPGQATQPLLVFRAATSALKAVALGQVARIEELDPQSIEWIDDRSVTQYRGALMPIICVDGKSAAVEGETHRPLLVFSRGERTLGVLVDEIVDIVDGSVNYETGQPGAGEAASLVVAGRATELIDVDTYWRMVDGGSAHAARSVAADGSATPGPHGCVSSGIALTKRLLVVDQSPFTQLLLGPLLAQAGYSVEVAPDLQKALALHDGGAVYDLILADTSPASPHAREMAQVFGRATGWHSTPLLGLGAHRLDTPTGLSDFAHSREGEEFLSAVSETLEPIQGAA